MVDENPLVNGRYTYIRECKWPPEAIDIHHVVVGRSRAKRYLIYLSVVIVLANSLFLVLSKNESVTVLFWSFIFCGFLAKLLLWTPVEKETVIIMPALGVQLETRYLRNLLLVSSFRLTHFDSFGPNLSSTWKNYSPIFPLGKILRPVLVECVTPVTCYWSLSLILRDEGELMLVFKELRPPLKMLVPIWKALCAVIDGKERPDTEDG